MMRTGELYRGAPLGREKGQVREGLRYVWHTPELRSTLLLTLVVGTFAINSPVVLPLLAKITFGGNAEVYSWMTIAMGAGAVFGALFVANKAYARGSLLFATGMAFGVSMLVASFAPSLASQALSRPWITALRSASENASAGCGLPAASGGARRLNATRIARTARFECRCVAGAPAMMPSKNGIPCAISILAPPVEQPAK
jgi:hypothetical protein